MAGFCHIWIPNYGLIARSVYEKVERKKIMILLNGIQDTKGPFKN